MSTLAVTVATVLIGTGFASAQSGRVGAPGTTTATTTTAAPSGSMVFPVSGAHTMVQGFGAPRSGHPHPPAGCQLTSKRGESFQAFVGRLPAGGEGCLLAGTYAVGGNFGDFKAGQTIHPAPSARGFQRVIVRGTFSIGVDDLHLDDFFLQGVQNPANVKVIDVYPGADNLVLDHLDITSGTSGKREKCQKKRKKHRRHASVAKKHKHKKCKRKKRRKHRSEPAYTDFQGILSHAVNGLQVTNNRIHHVGNDGQFDQGIYCGGPTTGSTIRGNWIYDNAAFAIQFYPDCDNMDFSYNVVDGNGAVADCNPSPGGGCPPASDNGRGIAIAGEGSSHSDNVNVHNNVISSFGAAGRQAVHCYLPGTGNRVTDSLLYEGSGSPVWDCGSSVASSGVIVANPRYVNRLAHDYRLAPKSPATGLMGSYATAVPGPRS